MPERPSRPRKKAGVHGWRAFFMVFGCGTTAALLVVAIFVGAIRMLGGAVTQEENPSIGGAGEGSWEPAPSMTAGALDLCSTLETSNQTGAFKSMFPRRADDNDDYADPGPGANGRVVSDDCEWDLKTPQHGEWSFRLAYEASASGASESSRIEQAEASFEQSKRDLDQEFSSVSETEEMEGMAEQAYAQYGEADGGESGSLYILLGRSRSGVFRMEISNPDEQVPMTEFRELARSLAPVLSSRLERILPA